MASAASLLGARHLRKVVENKPASSLVVSLGKALNGTPHFYVEDRWPISLEKGNWSVVFNKRAGAFVVLNNGIIIKT